MKIRHAERDSRRGNKLGTDHNYLDTTQSSPLSKIQLPARYLSTCNRASRLGNCGNCVVIGVIGVIGDRPRLFLSLGKSACQEIIVVPNCVCFAQYHGSALPGNRSSSFAICEQPLGGLYWQRPSVCKYRLDRATDKPSLPPPRHISTARAHSPPTVTALMIIARAFAGFGQP